MEFDHVIRVNADGTVSDRLEDNYAPELDPEDESVGEGWELLRGYTGQCGYNGPMMHDSEFIGGGLARDILSKPGYYVALVGQYYTDSEGNELEESDLEGWAIAYKELD